MYEHMGRQMLRQTKGQKDTWTVVWMNGQTDVRTDGWADRQAGRQGQVDRLTGTLFFYMPITSI